jgi:hypothetical protein
MSQSWRDHILQAFTPQVARLTIVADPDGLLTEEGNVAELRERGFDLLLFDDPIAFRFAYESKYRSRWDRGELTELVVVLRAATLDLRGLPYDLLQAGRQLSFNLGDLFPNLSYPVITTLDRGDLDALYRAQRQQNPGKLGDNATKDFILRHVFEVTPELIKRPPDLLRILLRRHYQGQQVPAVLDERFMQVLRQNGSFDDWPLEVILLDRHAFFDFLQKRWPRFVQRWLVLKDITRSRGTEPAIAEPDVDAQVLPPVDLPFDHDDVRVYIDNLFLEGLLQPIDLPNTGNSSQVATQSLGWVSVGLRTDQKINRGQRSWRLLQTVKASIPQHEARGHEWLTFARRWAESIVLKHEIDEAEDPALFQQLRTLQEKVDATFMLWVQQRYGSLYNQPALPPLMLHHIARFLARHLQERQAGKIALLVLDGLALDQWLVIRELLVQQRPQLHLHEESVFAWLPTITTVSRQSIFAGKPPLYYPTSLQTTDKEAILWSQFWADHGLTPGEVVYARGLGELSTHSRVEEILSSPHLRVVGFVIDTIDKIMHGMQLGTAGMHNQVHQWTKQGFLAQMLDSLLEKGFVVFLTSDHGNIEAQGCGRPTEGVVADLRGERVRVYPDQALRTRVNERFPDAIAWPPVGLPEDYLPLLAPNRHAFIQSGDRIVGHGGISLEELIVPFVRIE